MFKMAVDYSEVVGINPRVAVILNMLISCLLALPYQNMGKSMGQNMNPRVRQSMIPRVGQSMIPRVVQSMTPSVGQSMIPRVGQRTAG